MFVHLTNLLNQGPDANSNFNSISDFLGFALNIAIGVGISMSVIFFVISGIKFMSSGGDPKGTEEARQALTYAVVGLVLVLAAFTVRILILSVLGSADPQLYNEVPSF